MNVMIESHAIDIECASLGSRLKSARIAKNITQNELAKMVGVSRGKIVAAEKGRTTTATFVAIMIVLGREDELGTILGGEPLPTQPEKDIRIIKKRQRASRKHE